MSVEAEAVERADVEEVRGGVVQEDVVVCDSIATAARGLCLCSLERLLPHHC